MALRVPSPPDPAATVQALREAIAGAIPDAEIEVAATSPGHFTITVASQAFEGRTRVQQQQLVYRAIAPLLAGDAAPVHAIDRLQTKVP
jgi:stress-induced morphogen